MLARFLANHVLANLSFAVVLVMGVLSYQQLPREQDPTINFNWIDITTLMPGASAQDTEKQVTEVLEDAVANVADVRFVSSNSREGVSSVLVRFQDVDDTTFDKRVNDLRREIQNKEGELPQAAETPIIFEVTSANAFPTATVVVSGPANDDNLRRQSEIVKQDLERLKGVDRVISLALQEPELQVLFAPQKLEQHDISPPALADTVSRYYRDLSAGNVLVNRENWLVRLAGANGDAERLAALPVLTANGEVPLRSLASIERGREKAERLVYFNGRPAVLLAVSKQADSNLLTLVARVKDYIEQRNQLSANTGVVLSLVDDQTEITRNALTLMQNNSLLGLVFVLLVTWMFLGFRMAALTCIGIPFILAGTFWVLASLGQTLNVTVLLGVVISLGMLVDDAVVVVEAIFYRLQRGADALQATLAALREVWAPVTTAVLTTIAAFLPLMLLPGILGKFMLVIPLVVTVALLISLVEAYWMLPAHIMAANIRFSATARGNRMRRKFLARLRRTYARQLVRVLRWPKLSLLSVLAMIAGAACALGSGAIRFDFFASDPLRIFYITVQMPTGTPLQDTMRNVLKVERKARTYLQTGETRSVVSYAGQAFTEIAPLFGDHYGQIMISLQPKRTQLRDVDAVIEAMREAVEASVGPSKVSFLRLTGGPPSAKPISVKVRGDNIQQLRAAVSEIKTILATDPAIFDLTDDDSPGPMELELSLDHAGIQRAGIDPATVARTLVLLVDGEIVSSFQERGETVNIRIKAQAEVLAAVDDWLRYSFATADGVRVPLTELVTKQTQRGQGNIRHYNFRRTITVEADIDRRRTDTVQANARLIDAWQNIRNRYPNIDLDFSGELDDIQESLDAIASLFLFGIGLIYVILGTQFKSYFQPLLILATVPVAFTGVVLGLLITANPLSLFTLYGVVALAGIAVNSAIVLISAANARLRSGMSVLHATVYAARRRVVPILITSLTTIAGLFSLAAGIAGHSLIWGPVATAIVWGLGFSTILTLFMIPLLFRLSMGRRYRPQTGSRAG